MSWNREYVYRILRCADKNPSSMGLCDSDLPNDAEIPGTSDVDLVCAAPEMFEALEKQMEAYEHYRETANMDKFNESFSLVLKALKKARDES